MLESVGRTYYPTLADSLEYRVEASVWVSKCGEHYDSTIHSVEVLGPNGYVPSILDHPDFSKTACGQYLLSEIQAYIDSALEHDDGHRDEIQRELDMLASAG